MGVGTIVTVNRVLSLWDRTAVRRAGYVIAAVVFFAGTVAYLNVRSEDSAAPVKVVPGTDVQQYGAKIPLPKDAVDVGKKFIDDAVLRKDLADGWAISTPTVHADLTRSAVGDRLDPGAAVRGVRLRRNDVQSRAIPGKERVIATPDRIQQPRRQVRRVLHGARAGRGCLEGQLLRPEGHEPARPGGPPVTLVPLLLPNAGPTGILRSRCR